MSKGSYIIPIFVPHDGCPFDCVFCNQRKITGLETSMDAAMVKDIIEEYKITIGEKSNKHIEVAFFGGSFTGIDMNIQNQLLSVAKRYKDDGYIDDIRLSTRPDYIDNKILENLIAMGVSVIELGVQSLNQEVLDKSNRGHTKQDVVKASKLIRNKGIKLGLQMMVGLPGDTLETVIETAKGIIQCLPSFVRIYPTLVVKGTALEKQYENGQYKALEVEDRDQTSYTAYSLFVENNIKVIRVGLQPTDHISLGNDVVAGPFHPSIRQLVEGKIILDRILCFLGERKFANLVVRINNKKISQLVGNKKTNYILLKNKYPNSRITFKSDEDIASNKLVIEIDNEVTTVDLLI